MNAYLANSRLLFPVSRRKLSMLLCLLFLACNASANLNFDENIRLYTSDQVGFRIDEAEKALHKVFSESKPVVLFIHGRGDEPKKSLDKTGFIVSSFGVEGQAVKKLESQYGVKVLMFSWDSKRGGFGPIGLKDRKRPLSKMAESAKALNLVLEKVKVYRGGVSPFPFMLHAHSMGTIVLETLVEAKSAWVSERPVFSSVLLTSADADNLGHATWISKIASVERVWVTINKDDNVLEDSKKSRKDPKAVALGLNTGPDLAGNAIYVDITGLSSKQNEPLKVHECFNTWGMHEQVNVRNFFDSIFAGRRPEFTPENSTEIIPGRRFALKFHRDPNDPRFFKPDGK